jgi:hypothetical protein
MMTGARPQVPQLLRPGDVAVLLKIPLGARWKRRSRARTCRCRGGGAAGSSGRDIGMAYSPHPLPVPYPSVGANGVPV